MKTVSIKKKGDKSIKEEKGVVKSSDTVKAEVKKSKKIIAKTKTPTSNIEYDSNNTNTDSIIDMYEFRSDSIPINITIIKKKGEFVPIYTLQISVISKTTEMILEKVRLELIRRVSLGAEDIGNMNKTDLVEDKFNQLIDILIDKYFPDSDVDTINFLRAYLKINSLGFRELRIINER